MGTTVISLPKALMKDDVNEFPRLRSLLLNPCCSLILNKAA